MSVSHFRFKQFTIHHDRATMKVGTDGVLLGAWAIVHTDQYLLDIGTGSGLIALMLAQRTINTGFIDAVEIEKYGAEQAIENVHRSPWAQRIKVHQMAIQDFNPERKYDLIISNPPYFQNSFKPPDEKRVQTRHTVFLPFADLIASVNRLLATDGKFNVILPNQEGLAFIDLAKSNHLHCTRQWSFRTRNEKPIERWLLEFSFQEQSREEGEIILYKTGEEWSDGYKALTKEFYLKL